LFEGLSSTIGDERVAIVGRNGVGKSTLLALLAGLIDASSGRVELASVPCLVPQLDEDYLPLSRGEQRRAALEQARVSGAQILLLDEPTLHLDDGAVEWLRGWLGRFAGCLLVASHDRRLLADFRHFFVVSESGCHYFGGSLAELSQHLEREHRAEELRYASNLHRLAEKQQHTEQVARRRLRKKRSGRTRELDRCTSKMLLNTKRGQAQVYQGRLTKLREARLAALRDWTRASRRALSVELSFELALPELPPEGATPVLALRGVGASVNGRRLFESLDLELGRQRIAVVGPNGAGKTTLLEIMLGQRRPGRGSVEADASRIGYIAQGGKNWLRDESLRELLGSSAEESARLLAAHRFPLALAERPLSSLSPGERARAALIALFARSPTVEVLVLDEPTFSLDLVGLAALTRALKLWQGGLVVASHDRTFLDELELARTIDLRSSSPTHHHVAV
jgi:ATPase subunit of ABC transporter with duplicated ATPase domains